MKKLCFVEPTERAAALKTQQRLKMAASAHAYVRGSTVRFYEWLQSSKREALPEGPAIWICGDCHVGNIGPVANTEGALALQIRDLDQTVIGNPAHDLVRLALSLAMAARSSDLPGVVTAHMMEHIVAGYEQAFAEDSDEAFVATPATVKLIMQKAAGRSWRHLADERIEGEKQIIPLGSRFWPITGEERDAVQTLFATEDVRRLVTALRSRKDDAPVRILDAAYWKKGCSSLGLLRLAVLVAVGEGRAERHCLVDLKEAVATAAPTSMSSAMPVDNAARVVAGARALSPFLGSRMQAAAILDKSIFMRELLPQDLKLEIEHLTVEEAVNVAGFLAQVVGRSHARQMGADERGEWSQELGRHRSKTLDAPSWLWDSVVELVGVHESAYLQHCRRHALGDA